MTVGEIPVKLNMHLPYNLALLFASTYPREMKELTTKGLEHSFIHGSSKLETAHSQPVNGQANCDTFMRWKTIQQQQQQK